jgi:hypothetical protein
MRWRSSRGCWRCRSWSPGCRRCGPHWSSPPRPRSLPYCGRITAYGGGRVVATRKDRLIRVPQFPLRTARSMTRAGGDGTSREARSKAGSASTTASAAPRKRSSSIWSARPAAGQAATGSCWTVATSMPSRRQLRRRRVGRLSAGERPVPDDRKLGRCALHLQSAGEDYLLGRLPDWFHRPCAPQPATDPSPARRGGGVATTTSATMPVGPRDGGPVGALAARAGRRRRGDRTSATWPCSRHPADPARPRPVVAQSP